MLSLFAFGISQTTPWIGYRDVPKLLESIGYPYDSVEGGNLYDTVTHLGAAVQVLPALGKRSEEHEGDLQAVGLVLKIEIPVGRDVPLHEANQPFGSFVPSSEPHVMPHLGRTVTIVHHIDLLHDFSHGALREKFDKFWQFGAAYARYQGGKFVAAPTVDWSKVKLSDSLIIDYPDYVSFARATASWGLKSSSKTPYPPDYPSLSFDFDGVAVQTTIGSLGNKAGDHCFDLSSTIRLPQSVNALDWVLRVRTQNRWAQLTPNATSSVGVWQKIDVSKGVTLGDFRKRMTTFGDNVRALQSSVGP
jgi:hypothetical protein